MEKCSVCGKEFSTNAALAQHLKDKHGQTSTVAAAAKESTPQPSVKRQKPGSLRRRNRHPVALGILAIAVVAGIGVYFVVAPSLTPPPFNYILNETYIHVHPYLQIWIDGKNITIPTCVGIFLCTVTGGSASGSNFEPIHTHDASGILHIELSKADAASHNYTLDNFFAIWKWSSSTVMFDGTSHPVVFSQTDILGYTADATHHIYLLICSGSSCVNSTEWGSLNLEQLDYCDSTAAIANNPPCSPTAGGNPLWDGAYTYPYGTGHKIIIKYVSA